MNYRKAAYIFLSLSISIITIFIITDSGLKADNKPAESLTTATDVKKVTGILIKIDVKKSTVYIKENSRTVKFKASADICNQFKDRLNSVVDITYTKGHDRALRIITMSPAEIPIDSMQ